MSPTHNFSLDQETIRQLGLRRSEREINAQTASGSPVYEYPGLANVYIMESDLYGNAMPEGSCFLAFEGRSGLVGKHLSIATLKSSSMEEIKKIADDNNAG